MKSPTTISARDVAATNAHTYPGIGVSDKRRVRRVASRARLHDAAQKRVSTRTENSQIEMIEKANFFFTFYYASSDFNRFFLNLN